MMDKLVNKLKTVNLWYLLLISVLLSEMITGIAVSAMSVVFQGRITSDYLITGSVTALFASLLVCSIILIFVQLLLKTEKSLLKKTAYLESIFRSSTDMAIAATDRDLNIQFYNPMAEKIFGYKAEEVIGRTVLELHTKEKVDAHRLQMAIEQVQKEGEYSYIVEQVKDGETRYISSRVTGIWDKNNELIGFVLMSRDFTERKRIADSLRQSELFLRNVFDAIQDGICVLDSDLNIVRVNSSMEKIYGEKMPLTPHNKCYEVYQKRVSICPCCPSIRTLETGQVQSSVMPCLSSGKPTCWIDVTSFPLKDDEGNVEGVIEYVRDITERKYMEEELAKTQALLLAAIEQTPAGIIIADAPDVRIRSANSAALEIRGSTPGPLTDILVEQHSENWQTFHPDGTQCKAEDLPLSQAVLYGKTSKNVDITIRRQSGEERWVLANAAPVRNANGDIIAGVVVFNDITDRRRMEEDLKESEEKYRKLVETANDAIFVADTQTGIILDVNKSAEQLLGMPAEKIIGMHQSQLHPQEEAEFYRDIFKMHSESGKGIIKDLFVCHKDGHRIPVEISASVTELRGKKIIQGIFRDITEQKQVEKALRESEEQIRYTVENAPLGIGTLNLDGTFRSVNQAYCDMVGYSFGELLTKTFRDITHPDDIEKSLRGIIELIEKKASHVELEKRYIHKNGFVVNVIQRGSIVHDSQGKPLFIIGIAENITDRKRMEEELLKAQKLESIGILAGGIAHDFNNYLTAIIGNISLAQFYCKPQDKTFEKLKEAEKASLRAQDLTQQLLTFSKGGAPIKKKASISQLLEDSASFAIRGANVKCTFSISDDIMQVEVDEGQISQVISNLIINANQAMPKGGTITVKCENFIKKTEDTLPLKDGPYVKISIEDQGTGIAKKDIKKIFDPYFTTKTDGTGLGLAICYSIMKNHHGHIDVESEINKGTTFSVYIPASGKNDVIEKEKKESLIKGKGKVLIMDDEEMVRNVAAEMLKAIGYDTEFAQDGNEALKIYKQAKDSGQPFDVVIMDLTIPGGMGGKEAVSKLLEIDPQAKAIVSSGYSHDPIMADFKKYHFSAVIAKPYKVNELSKILHNVMIME